MRGGFFDRKWWQEDGVVGVDVERFPEAIGAERVTGVDVTREETADAKEGGSA